MFTTVGRLIGFKVRGVVNFVFGYYVDDSQNTIYYVDDSQKTYYRYQD